MARRVARKRRVAREEAIRAAEEDLKANSALAAAQRRIEIQMQRTQAETQKEKEMLGEFREDAEKGINGAKRFAGSTRRQATAKAMVRPSPHKVPLKALQMTRRCLEKLTPTWMILKYPMRLLLDQYNNKIESSAKRKAKVDQIKKREKLMSTCLNDFLQLYRYR